MRLKSVHNSPPCGPCHPLTFLPASFPSPVCSISVSFRHWCLSLLLTLLLALLLPVSITHKTNKYVRHYNAHYLH